ncbi:Glycosyltransferase involved in cell wall bisynthesis [Persephonella hydrogeniphila]|uniref:Glycosyltransferase involved in cell wall bisynthesis n=1 Tax=Persephonella hydrogeniphila TaxID=198703 RepID=A0A285NB48_9AQUI|nr:DUF1972 domain-containing protein [Persephonella hydrogeniphila]SNZ06157.1 Glycosyltransferase involved in cell wall bisynthesis [Persephonella hydrogeniphila]
MKKNNKKKKIHIIGTVGLPPRYGGFETLTDNLVEHLSKDFDIVVFCSSKFYKEKLKEYKGAKLEYIPLNANGIESIIYDSLSMIRSINRSDVMLILGVSGCIVLPILKKFYKGKIIVNIDGLEWKRSKWNSLARNFLKLSEKFAVNYSDAVISDNRAIQEYVKKEYGKDSYFIAYGGDHLKKEELTKESLERYPFLKEEYALTVCRIEPENNIHIMLEAFKKYKKMNYVIAGNFELNKYGQELKKKYENEKNIFMLNIYDRKILNQFRSHCKIYVHGHSAGGTNPSLVEAMYFGLPIIAYDVIFNRETTKNRAEYFKDAEELINILENLNYSALERIGKEMFNIAKEEYTWSKIINKYKNLFNEV